MRKFNDIAPAARRVLLSEDGKLVLDHLLDRFYHNNIKNETLARQVGQRDVLIYLRLLLEDRHDATDE